MRRLLRRFLYMCLRLYRHRPNTRCWNVIVAFIGGLVRWHPAELTTRRRQRCQPRRGQGVANSRTQHELPDRHQRWNYYAKASLPDAAYGLVYKIFGEYAYAIFNSQLPICSEWGNMVIVPNTCEEAVRLPGVAQ